MSEIDEHITRRYEIKKRLGQGAYGVVWKALDKKTKTVVAVKKIYDAFRNKTDAQRTFREIMFLQEFGEHPNIIKLLGIHKANNNRDIYLVFEFMDTDLHNVIKRGHILKDVHKRYIMYQLLKATKYIHSGNVIHRDQKPSNILLDSDCHCKVADFGLARSLSQLDDGSGERLTDPPLTDYVATRWYRAPEILVASKRYTQGIDMWSLGCILAEMLLGKPLFPGSSTINQMERIMCTLPTPSPEDMSSVFAGYGSSLLQKPPPGPRKSLRELLHGASSDAIDLVSKLIVFNPTRRLTADQALEHPYVSRFHDRLREPSLGHNVLPPLRDDVQLSVDDYRNKLYEIMDRHRYREKTRYPHCRTCATTRNVHLPARSHHCSTNGVPCYSAHTNAVHVTPCTLASTASAKVTANVRRTHPVALRGVQQRRRNTLARSPQRQPCVGNSWSNSSLLLHATVPEGTKMGTSGQPHIRPNSLLPISDPRKAQVTRRMHNVQQKQSQACLTQVPQFNTYVQSHGILTQSALMQLRPNIRW